jgi:predicted RNA-binding protein with PIN domain
MPLLIDGYNVLHQSGLLGKGRGPGWLERARRALVGTVAAALTADEARETTIVFDAKQAPPEAAPVTQEHGLHVRYAVGYEDADALLVELIRRAPQPKRLVVVSSDRLVQQAARRQRAQIREAADWFHALRRGGAHHPPPPGNEKPDEPLSAEEQEYWRDVFGGE